MACGAPVRAFLRRNHSRLYRTGREPDRPRRGHPDHGSGWDVSGQAVQCDSGAGRGPAHGFLGAIHRCVAVGSYTGAPPLPTPAGTSAVVVLVAPVPDQTGKVPAWPRKVGLALSLGGGACHRRLRRSRIPHQSQHRRRTVTGSVFPRGYRPHPSREPSERFHRGRDLPCGPAATFVRRVEAGRFRNVSWDRDRLRRHQAWNS